MRVSLVTETYLPQVNGVSRTLSHLAASLAEQGDEVQLIHPDYGDPAVGPSDLQLPALALPFYPDVKVPLPFWGRLRRALEAFRPDLIHIATEATLGFGALRVARALGIPVVSSFHTNFDQYSEHYWLGWAKGPIWRYLRWFHNATRETYVPSQPTIEMLTRRGFERLVLWPRGVDGRLFRPDRPGRESLRDRLGIGPDEVVIGHVSRLAREKNVAFLAEALRRVLERRGNVRALIVGDGPMREEFERILGSRACFVGYRSGEDLADHYAAADLFAFASRTETFGNVVLEALASGLPVVAIRAGGVASVLLDGITGHLLTDDGDPEAFAARLIELADDPGRRHTLAEAARRHAETQSWAAINHRLRERYLAVVEGRRRPLPVS